MRRNSTVVLFCILVRSCNTLGLYSEEAVENRLETIELQAACLRALRFCFNHIPESIENGFVPPQILKEEPANENIIEVAAFVLNLFLRELSDEDLQKAENGTYNNEDYTIIQESYINQFLAYAAKLHSEPDSSLAVTCTMYLYREQFLLQIANYVRLVFSLPLLGECAYSSEIDRLFFPVWRLRIYFLALFIKQCGVTRETLDTVFTREDIKEQIDTLTREKLNHEERARLVVDAFFYFTLSQMETIDTPLDHDGKTLLICCALKGDTEKVEFLCKQGASIAHKDKIGNTALRYAELFGHTDLIDFFRSLQDQPEVTTTQISCEQFKFDCIEKSLQKMTEYVVQEIRFKRQDAQQDKYKHGCSG